VDLYADRRQACPVVDPLDRELIISCGCALFNLRTAMLRFAALGGVEIFPSLGEVDLIARVWMGKQADISNDGRKLFGAITRRRTNRQGARRQWADNDFREELAQWIHSIRTPRDNGIPGHAFSVDDLMSSAEPALVRTFDLGDGQAGQDEELAGGSPILAVLMTKKDNPRAWLAAGQALERILLLARGDNVWCSFLNQPVEVADLRPKLMSLMGHSGMPQIVLRLGYGDDITPTPRRPLEEVLIT